MTLYFSINFFFFLIKIVIPSFFILFYFLFNCNVFLFNYSTFFFKTGLLSQQMLIDFNAYSLRFMDCTVLFFLIILKFFSKHLEISFILFQYFNWLDSILSLFFFLSYCIFLFNFNTRSDYLFLKLILLLTYLPVLFFNVTMSWFIYFFLLEFISILLIWLIVFSSKGLVESTILYLWVSICSAILFNLSIIFSYQYSTISAVFFISFICLKLGVYPFGLWVAQVYSNWTFETFFLYLCFFYLQTILMVIVVSENFLKNFLYTINPSSFQTLLILKCIILVFNLYQFINFNFTNTDKDFFILNTWSSSLVVLMFF